MQVHSVRLVRWAACRTGSLGKAGGQRTFLVEGHQALGNGLPDGCTQGTHTGVTHTVLVTAHITQRLCMPHDRHENLKCQ